jgi:hypothetical protein
MSLAASYNADLARVQLTADTFAASTARGVLTRYTSSPTNQVTVRGGTFDPLADSDTIAVDDYEFTPGVLNTYLLTTYDADGDVLDEFTATVTPDITQVWLKSIARPFLNRTVTVTDWSDVTQPARGAVLDVIGRRRPVAINEVRGSRRYNLTLVTDDTDEADALELMLSFGDTLLIQPPADCPIPAPLYAWAGDVTTARRSTRGPRRYITLPLVEVDAPAPELVGYTVTWGGIVSAFSTWADVQSEFTDWLAVQEYVSDPSDETVG